jgi:hypothetical protein
VLFKPLLIGELSGSVGALTASHNKGGAYIRSRVIPTNPGTPAQTEVRNLMGQFAARWTNTLSAAQRQAWDTYALNVPLLNRLGESVTVTGLNMYQRSNIPRAQNGLSIVDDGPTTFNLGDFTAPTIASFTSPTVLSLTFEVADDWVSEDDAAMLIFGSRDTGIAINFFKGPYRKYPIQLLGDNAVPPTSPHPGTNPFNISVGNQVFLKAAVTRADGRYSLITRLTDVAV